MKKVKKIVAAAVAAASMSAIGLTAFADFGNFSFAIVQYEDLYFDVSSGVKKMDFWEDNPAEVRIKSGNLTSSNRADIWVTANRSWPESDIISETKIVSSIGTYFLNYDGEKANRYTKNNMAYLAASTGDDVTFSGQWMP